MKVLIVDDEPLARTRLTRLMEKHEGYEVIAEAENGERAIEACNEHDPDLVFMDIRMPVMDGLQAARHLALLDHSPAVIFCTAYDDYALQAFDANAVDYLLKPVSRDKLAQALDKAQTPNRLQLSALIEHTAEGEPEFESIQASKRSHISAKSTRGIELIPIADVRYFLADQKYVTVYYYQEERLREILIDDPLKELEQELGSSFVRIHRNALVAVEHIQGMEKTSEGMRLKMAAVDEGPYVSRRHLATLKKLMQQL